LAGISAGPTLPWCLSIAPNATGTGVIVKRWRHWRTLRSCRYENGEMKSKYQ
jgi:hypothetical protein